MSAAIEVRGEVDARAVDQLRRCAEAGDAPQVGEWLDGLAADGFGHWLAGFIDGEGSFLINRLNPKPGTPRAYSCTFRVQLRSDDAAILEVMRWRTGLGRIGHRPDRRDQMCGSRPASYWTIARKAEIARLALLFGAFPMRAKKGVVDFPIWREAVRCWVEGSHYARSWEEMATLKARLEDARRYRPLTPVGVAIAGPDTYDPWKD